MNSYLSMLRREAAPPNWMGLSRSTTESDNESISFSSPKDKKTADGTIVTELLDEKSGQLSRRWQAIAAGTGLFSDGYLNNSIGFVTQFLSLIYGDSSFDNSVAMSNIGGLGYAGCVVGMVGFGLVADRIGRKTGLIICTLMLIIFSILAAGSWGIGMPHNPSGMFAALSVWRVMLGIGIGGEYPCGSAACAEASSRFDTGSRHRWVIWSTCSAIDVGFFVSSIVAFVLLYICSVPGTGGTHGMQTAWRVQLGLGAIPPMALLFMRFKLKETREYRTFSASTLKPKLGLVAKHWGPQTVTISIIWLIYDMLSYSWGLITPFILTALATTNGESDIRKAFAWTILFNFFYLPGTFLGGISADWIGPRLTITFSLVFQAIVGFCTAAYFPTLRTSVGAFVVVYGIFTSLGESGPGDNTIVYAAKMYPTPVRGRLYGVAAAFGKIGALIGTYAFPAIARRYGGVSSDHGISTLFYLSSALCLFSALLSLLLPELTQQSAAEQDSKYQQLMRQDADISQTE